MNTIHIKLFAVVFFLILFVPKSKSQINLDQPSISTNGDIIHLNNGVSLNCEVVEVSDNIVFYEQSPSKELFSASLSEVSEIEMGQQCNLNLSDSTKPKQVDALYVQGMKDGKKYYRITHRGSFQNLKNPRNALLSNPTYEAGYEAGAKKKKTWSWVLIGLFSPLYILLILILSFFWTLLFFGELWHKNRFIEWYISQLPEPLVALKTNPLSKESLILIIPTAPYENFLLPFFSALTVPHCL